MNIFQTIENYLGESYLGAFVASFVFFLVSSLLWRGFQKKVLFKNSAQGGMLSTIGNAIRTLGYFFLFFLSVYIFLEFSPDFKSKGNWLIGFWLLTSFSGVLLLGESLFAGLVDYYMSVRRGTEIPSIFKQLFKVIIYLIVGLSFLSTTYKIDITPLLTTSAVFTMVIGLALQDSLGNLFSGLSVHISPPFKIGDWIRVAGLFGKVIESNWRATTLRTPINELIVLPNNDIAKKEILNHCFPEGLIKQELLMGLPYGASPDTCRRVLSEACEQVKEISRIRPPDIFLDNFGDSAINYLIVYWINENLDVRQVKDQLSSRIWYRLKREGLSIPYPIREIFTHPERDFTEQVITRRLELISSIDFLNHIDRTHQAFIAKNLKEYWFEAGETIVKRGEEGTDFYILERGQVDVFLEDSLNSKIASLQEGSFFGEMSLLTGEPRSATVRAGSETKLLVLNREILHHVLEDNPNLAKILSDSLSERQSTNIARQNQENNQYRGPEEEREEKSFEQVQASSVLFEKIKRFFRLR